MSRGYKLQAGLNIKIDIFRGVTAVSTGKRFVEAQCRHVQGKAVQFAAPNLVFKSRNLVQEHFDLQHLWKNLKYRNT